MGRLRDRLVEELLEHRKVEDEKNRVARESRVKHTLEDAARTFGLAGDDVTFIRDVDDKSVPLGIGDDQQLIAFDRGVGTELQYFYVETCQRDGCTEVGFYPGTSTLKHCQVNTRGTVPEARMKLAAAIYENVWRCAEHGGKQ